jgi:TPR repeat protein
MDPQKKSVGVSYEKLNPAPAIEACQQAIKIEPDNSRIWFELGRALEKAGNISESVSAYQKAAQLGSAAAYNNIGELYRQGKGFPKNKEKAAEFFKKSEDLGSTEGRDNLAALNKSK